MTNKRKRIAIIGGGISGISAAWLLQKEHDTFLYEASDRLGGHANPIKLDDSEKPL